MKYAEKSAEAQKNVDRLKEEIDIERARLNNVFRSLPEKYGCPQDSKGNYKITEAWVDSLTSVEKTYQDLSSALTQARFELNLMSAAVRAFDHRKKSLEGLVQLWLGGFFSVPNEKKLVAGAKRVIADTVQKSTDNQREALGVSRRRRSKNEEG